MYQKAWWEGSSIPQLRDLVVYQWQSCSTTPWTPLLWNYLVLVKRNHTLLQAVPLGNFSQLYSSFVWGCSEQYLLQYDLVTVSAKFSAGISQYSITNAKEGIYWDYWLSAQLYLRNIFPLLKKLFLISSLFENNILISVQALLTSSSAPGEMNCVFLHEVGLD